LTATVRRVRELDTISTPRSSYCETRTHTTGDFGTCRTAFCRPHYPLWSDLWHAKWLVQMNDNECEPMFLQLFCRARSVFVAGREKTLSASLPNCFLSVVECFPCHCDGRPEHRSVESWYSPGLYGCGGSWDHLSCTAGGHANRARIGCTTTSGYRHALNALAKPATTDRDLCRWFSDNRVTSDYAH
jgi:hypothetical protein